ncbi:MAG: TadA family conjugal transfer-associated ATPase, partial [Sciscionella sp.]
MRGAPPSRASVAVNGTLVEKVRQRLVGEQGAIDAAMVARALRAETGGVAGDADVLHALRQLQSEFVGLGPLEPLLRDPAVTDVLVAGPDRVWLDGDDGLCATTVSFPDEDSVRRLAQRLALAAGRRLDDASPCVDGWLAGAGSDGDRRIRLHAVLPPIAGDGTCISLRILRPSRHTLSTLRACQTLCDDSLALLRAVISARLAFLITGATGSGKSTLLAAMLAAVPTTQRIVCVEDAGELRPAHPQFVRLLARQANVEGAGTVTMRELVRQALRMRPDRLVVGEVRGAEVGELLAALNTGHD